MTAPAFPIIVQLTGQPVGKGRARFVRATGHAYTPEKTRTYESSLKLAAMDVMGSSPPIGGALRVCVIACMPIPQSWSKKKQADALCGLVRPIGKPDADNFLKTLDSLNQVVWIDDAQIVDASIIKKYDVRPRLEIRVFLVGEQA